MRTHGWGGAPPADDAEALRRILDAGARCVDRDGADATTISSVAVELGVTRQTIYRYVPSTDELFSALAQDAADEFIARIASHMREFDDPTEVLVQGLAFGILAIPDERYLALLLRSGDAFTRGIISEAALRFGHDMLARSPVDFDALGYDAAERTGLVEYMLRLIQSLAVTPADPSGAVRHHDELCAFLRRWFAPAIVRPRPAGPHAGTERSDVSG